MNPTPITRQVISEFSTRSSATKLYKKGTAEYNSNIRSIFYDLQEYENVIFANEVFEQDGKFGVRNSVLGVLIPPIYDEICDYIAYMEYCNWAYGAKLNGKYGIVKADYKGTVIYPFELDGFDYTESLFNGHLIIKDDKWGAVNIVYGKVITIIEPIYDIIISIERFDGYDIPELLLLEKDGKYGLFFYGNIVPAIYDEFSIPSVMGWIRAKIGDEWYYIDSDFNPTKDVNNAFLTYANHMPYSVAMGEEE